MDESFKDLLEGMRRSFKDLFRRVAQLEMAGGKQIAVPGSGFSGSHDDLSDVSPDDHHDPVTLGSVAIENVLDLSTQDLTLDTQVANTVFAGPSVGADAEPTFRALVADDIPALAYLTAVGEGPGIDITGGDTVGLGGDTILLYDAGGAPVAEYAATDAGLTAALAAMAAGDVLVLPAVTISGGPWTVANGTLRGHSRFGSTLDGEVTVSTDCQLERLSVIRSEDDAGALYCVALEEDARVDGCLISMTNATGDAYGVYAQHDGDCYANDNIVLATGGGDGYGYYADGAEMWVSGGYVEASTAPVGVA